MSLESLIVSESKEVLKKQQDGDISSRRGAIPNKPPMIKAGKKI